MNECKCELCRKKEKKKQIYMCSDCFEEIFNDFGFKD